jgi:hypothetical protein
MKILLNRVTDRLFTAMSLVEGPSPASDGTTVAMNPPRNER